MEIHQLISRLQTPSKEEIRYKVGEVLGKSPTSEVEQALRLIYADEIRKREALHCCSLHDLRPSHCPVCRNEQRISPTPDMYKTTSAPNTT